MDTAEDQDLENPGGGSIANGANGTNGTNGANGQHQTPEGSLVKRCTESIEIERKMLLAFSPNVEISGVMPRCGVSKTWIIGHLVRYYQYIDAKNERRRGSKIDKAKSSRYDQHDREVHYSAHSLRNDYRSLNDADFIENNRNADSGQHYNVCVEQATLGEKVCFYLFNDAF
ncbi:hypothetical protein ALC62_15665 [Cyphomyrmex costatus]|uniref:Uncharacterized protein n=1 Tax=Cyphomyrmex costatus TaxID=456900 RepID=A0A151I6L1_9HYME|nr:hypothetical protein ALC62_15665 [Cyphomyrmex costatus]